MRTVVINKYGDDFAAWLQENSHCEWGIGKTRAEAIISLIEKNPDLFPEFAFQDDFKVDLARTR